MKTIFLYILSTLIALFLVSCENNEAVFTDLSFEDLGVAFVRTELSTVVIRSESEWNDYISKHIPPTANPIPMPKVDFVKEMVIGVSWGGDCRYSGCSYGRLIERISATNDRILVSVNRLEIIGSCDLCLEPLHFVKVAKSDLPIVFVGSIPR